LPTQIGDEPFYSDPLLQYHAEENKQYQPAWITDGSTILVHDTHFETPFSLLDDANGTVGRARLKSIGYQFTVKKINEGGNIARMVGVRVVGTMEDLYDFNMDTAGEGAAAAALQIGHGNGGYGAARQRGVIFRTQIEFDKDFTPNFNGFPDAPIP
jgi:hypothetical protein